MKRAVAWLVLCLMLVVFLPTVFAAGNDFSFSAPAAVRGFGSNPLKLMIPYDGELTITVSDAQGNLWRTIRQSVSVGATEIVWDGLGDCENRLNPGTYQLQAILRADGQAALQANESVRLSNNQALRAAIGSDPVLYRNGESWFFETATVRAGKVIVSVASADKPEETLLSLNKRLSSNGWFQWKWDGGKLPAGDYVMTLYAEDNPAFVRTIPVTISDEAKPKPSVNVTGSVFPKDRSDEAIWEAMMKPAVIVDLKKPTGHQEVFSSPNKKSAVLGTLHGQSQCVEVHSLNDSWAYITAYNHEYGGRITGYVPTSVLEAVAPNPTYGLLIDKQAQTLSVYEKGVKIATVPVSTGLMAEKKLFRETPAGSFLTLGRVSTFQTGKYSYQYAIRYDGGNLIHQMGYTTKGKNAVSFADESATMGQKASHGCVRVGYQAPDGGINACWLWANIPYHTRVLILDDPNERHELADALGLTVPADMADPSTPDAIQENPIGSSEVEALPTPVVLPAQSDQIITLTLGGDAVLGTREGWWKRADAFPAFLEEHGMAWPFEGLQSVFGTDDMTFVNLECVLASSRAGEDKDKLYRFRGLPAWTEVLHAGSIEQVNIANNHYIDYQSKGKKATRTALEEAKIPYSGYTYTYIWEYNGHKIGFAGCRETIYKRDRNIIREETKALREAGCEVVIYSCHWGQEYSPVHNQLQIEMANAAAEAGVDLIVGNHPHVVQGLGVVDKTAVIWSLGNLMFGGTIDLTTFDATLARVNMHFDEHGYKGLALTYLPIQTSSRASEGLNDYHPVLAEGADYERIMDLMQADTLLYNVRQTNWFPAR